MGGQPVLFFDCWMDACVRGLARSIRPCQSARPAGWSIFAFFLSCLFYNIVSPARKAEPKSLSHAAAGRARDLRAQLFGL